MKITTIANWTILWSVCDFSFLNVYEIYAYFIEIYNGNRNVKIHKYVYAIHTMSGEHFLIYKTLWLESLVCTEKRI